MNETVTIPKVEYDRLCALEEDFADIAAALAVEARIGSGEEELIPAGVVDRLIDGDPPLRVWREFRNLTQAGLARASGVNRCKSSKSKPVEAPDRFTRCASCPMLCASPWMTSFGDRTKAPADGCPLPREWQAPPGGRRFRGLGLVHRPVHREAGPRLDSW